MMPTEEERRAEHCNQGASHPVCRVCAEKYRTREPCDSITTCHEGKCYICEKQKVVSNSRKSFGFHTFV